MGKQANERARARARARSPRHGYMTVRYDMRYKRATVVAYATKYIRKIINSNKINRERERKKKYTQKLPNEKRFYFPQK